MATTELEMETSGYMTRYCIRFYANLMYHELMDVIVNFQQLLHVESVDKLLAIGRLCFVSP